MNARKLLIVLVIVLLAGAVYGQKKKRKRSIMYEVEQMIADSKGATISKNGDLIVALIDSSRAKFLTRITTSTSGKAPEDLTFELGDLTQVFTSLLIHELAADGKLDLQKSINELLPIAFQSIHFRDVSIQNCLSHTTRLPRIPNNIGSRQTDHNQPFEHYEASDLSDFIQQWTPSNMDKSYRYSLIGYELIDIILQHQFQKSFSQLIQEILNPIYGFETLTETNDGADMIGRNKVGNEVPPMKFASFISSSGLQGSSRDLVNLLVGPQLQSRPAFLQSLKIQSSTGIDESVSIASGWHHYKVNRHHAFYLHKGSSKGFSSFMAYHPRNGTGVVILSSTKVNLGPMGYFIMGKLNNGWKK